MPEKSEVCAANPLYAWADPAVCAALGSVKPPKGLRDLWAGEVYIDLNSAEIIRGDLGRRGPGFKAEIEYMGRRWRVYGASCGLPNCMCAARIKAA